MASFLYFYDKASAREALHFWWAVLD
jgi:hypothetical protein